MYAVWSKDVNGNGIADYLEKTFVLTYDLNGGTANEFSDSSPNHVAGEEVVLRNSPVPTHESDNGKVVVFLGWTLQRTDHIYKREETAPATVQSVTFGSKGMSVYAAWGYDSDEEGKPGHGVADVLETYTISYDLNGGKWKDAGLPDTFTASKGTVHTVQAKPVRAGFEFTGWKDSQGHMYDPGDTLKLEDSVTLTAQWQAVSQRSASSRTPRSDRSSRTARSARTAQATHQAFWLSLAAGSLAAAEALRKKRKKK